MSEDAGTHVSYLDGWRGLAIGAVLICHFDPHPSTGWLGEFGVQLFFVLSGYLISNLLFLKKESLKDFAVRRASRILPVFLLFVLTMVIYAENFQPARYNVTGRELLPTLTFLRSYFPVDLNIFARRWPIGHLWSLNIEEHSYVYLALGALVLKNAKSKYAAPALLILTMAAIVACTFYYARHPPSGAADWRWRSEVASLGLISSAALRVTASRLSRDWRDAVPPWLPLLTLLIAVACYATNAVRGGHLVGPLCLAFTVNFLHRTPALMRRLMSSGLLRWLGRCSFSMYLWQQPFYYAVLNDRVAAPLALATAVCAGAISFYLVEKPARRLLNRAWSTHRKLRGTARVLPGAVE